MTLETATALAVIASPIIAAFGVGSIWAGIRQMRRAGDQRAAREDQRHAEAMRALEALIERTGSRA